MLRGLLEHTDGLRADEERLRDLIAEAREKYGAQGVAPHLCDRQIVDLNPGRTCRAIEFAKMLRDRCCQTDVTIARASWIASSAWRALCTELTIGTVAARRRSWQSRS